MRDDVKVDTKNKVRIPSIQVGSVRPCTVGRGDFVEFKDPGNVTRMGRIIGTLNSPDDGRVYLCVVMISLGGFLCERWVLPDDVVNTRYGSDYMCQYGDKAKWFHSAAFLDTPVDEQRNVSNLLHEDLSVEIT
jgi:hypothetical protein